MLPKETNRIVLDTNILLDILVFEDASIIGLKEDIQSGLLIAWTRDEILEEFREVIARATFALEPDHQERLVQQARELHQIDNTSILTPAPFRCSDPDDQVFLDLALKLTPCLLISKDKEVLKLNSQARQYGVLISKSYKQID